MAALPAELTFHTTHGNVWMRKGTLPRDRVFVIHDTNDEDLYFALAAATETLGNMVFNSYPTPEPNPALEAFHQASAALYEKRPTP